MNEFRSVSVEDNNPSEMMTYRTNDLSEKVQQHILYFQIILNSDFLLLSSQN